MTEWKPAATAPYMTVVWVKNEQMDEPVLATRGYLVDGMVHENQEFFTSVYTPGDGFSFPSGRLVCPTEWKPADD
jgi:hypothetical protein